MSNPITTYTELKAAVKDWINREDQDSVIPQYIFMAEVRLNRKLRIFAMETVQFITATAGDKWLPYPSGYKGFRWLRRDNSTEAGGLTFVTPDKLNRNSRYFAQGDPEVYCLHGNRIQLGPIPNADMTMEAGVFENVPYLSDENPTNWWLENAPDALLYGALRHSSPYLKNDARAATWDAGYEIALSDIEDADQHYRYPAGALAMRRV